MAMTDITISTAGGASESSTHPVVLRVADVASRADDTVTLHPVSFSICSGQVVGIAGGSGAGKTTLLETMAGVRPASSGEVIRHEVSAFVPQDDIIHTELPLRRTLLHAASVRLDTDAQGRAHAVDAALRRLDLIDRADVVVADLSGGQRKRASLAAEMLTDPRLLFLDEPTSGLDPAKSSELVSSLRDLVAAGSTVVFTTHSPADLAACDRVVFVAKGGHVAFVGSPTEALTYFGVAELVEVYGLLEDWPKGRRSIDSGQTVLADAAEHVHPPTEATSDSRPGAVRQWLGLVKRNADLMVGNRLTLGIILGSPVFIISTMTALFPSGVFADDGQTAMAIQLLFWLGFNSFFFGLTYGLLQVVGEYEIIRRERRIGLSLSAYVASKLTVLVPLLGVVNVAQLVSMEVAGRLPDLSASEFLAMFASLQLLSMAAVAIGLHASASVRNPAQATLALPMLCFPQVLFAGAVVPINDMGWFAQGMSLPLAVRWGFEPLGRILDLGSAASLEPGTVGFEDTFTGSPAVGWAVLVGLAVFASIATIRTLHRRTTAISTSSS